MWRCPSCNEQIENNFDACWHCGTTRQGITDAGFQSQAEEPESERREPRRWRYSLRTLLLVVIFVAVVARLAGDPNDLVGWILVCIMCANLMGWLVGWFVTYVLKIPNDGSLTWHEQPEDHES